MKIQPPFFTLAKDPNLDQETAFTICRMIDSVGSALVEKWDWNWLAGNKKNYRALIDPALLDGAWKLLYAKDWYSQQTTNDVDKKISTISPLEGLTNLRTLVLQNNLIEDIRPLSAILQLKKLNCYQNRISDLTPLKNLQSLEELLIAENPVTSFRVIEELANLQELTISTNQIAQFVECRKLPSLRILRINGEDEIDNFTSFPEMPSLKVLEIYGVKGLNGIERFGLLENLELRSGSYSALTNLRKLKTLTHLRLSTSRTLDVTPLDQLHALRRLTIHCKAVQGVAALTSLPVLHDVGVDDETICDADELNALCAELTAWDTEFKASSKRFNPSLNLEVVDQETFDLYDAKKPYGIRPDECNERMLASERHWLVEEIRNALSAKFEDDKDFHLPYTSGFQRTERVVIYSVEAYEAFREIVLAIQQILCETKNDWIIWCQSLLWESPEQQDIPEGAEDFIVWIYPNKVMVAEKCAKVTKQLISWKN